MYIGFFLYIYVISICFSRWPVLYTQSFLNNILYLTIELVNAYLEKWESNKCDYSIQKYKLKETLPIQLHCILKVLLLILFQHYCYLWQQKHLLTSSNSFYIIIESSLYPKTKQNRLNNSISARFSCRPRIQFFI